MKVKLLPPNWTPALKAALAIADARRKQQIKIDRLQMTRHAKGAVALLEALKGSIKRAEWRRKHESYFWTRDDQAQLGRARAALVQVRRRATTCR